MRIAMALRRLSSSEEWQSLPEIGMLPQTAA